MVVDAKMEAACYISRGTEEPLGIYVLLSTHRLKIISVDGKGYARKTNVSFRDKAYVGIGLKLNDEIKQVNSTRKLYGMLKQLRIPMRKIRAPSFRTSISTRQALGRWRRRAQAWA